MTRLDVSTDCTDCEARIRAEVIDEFAFELKEYVFNKRMQGLEPYWFVAVKEVAEKLKEQK